MVQTVERHPTAELVTMESKTKEKKELIVVVHARIVMEIGHVKTILHMPAIANNSHGLAPIPAFLGSKNNARKHVMLVSLLVILS